jgi:hypothetical protein
MARKIVEIKYEIIKESDLSDQKIYAFGKPNDINVLCVKGGNYFWKPLDKTEMVWYKEYETLESAVEGILEVTEFKERGYSEIHEFDSLKEFIDWAYLLNHQS